MDISDFVFKDGGKRPIVKARPSASGSPMTPGSPVFGSRAPMPKFNNGQGGSPRSTVSPLFTQRSSSSSFKRNSSLSGNNVGSESNVKSTFVVNRSVKVSPKNNDGVRYPAKSPVKAKQGMVGGSSAFASLLVEKASTDKEVNSAQPSPRKSLRLQPEYGDYGSNNEKRYPTNDELRLFSVPPANSDERRNLDQNRFPSRGRDLTENVFPYSNKPGEKRSSTSLYARGVSRSGSSLGGTELIGGMEVVMAMDEGQERLNNNVTAEKIPDPEGIRPKSRNSIINTKVVPKQFSIIRQSSNGNLRRSVSKQKGFSTIVESMINIEPDENDRNQSVLGGYLEIPIIIGPEGRNNNHRVSESQVVNYDEDHVNDGRVVGRTSIQMVKMNEIGIQDQVKGSPSLAQGNTFKLDEHGLTGHLKWLYGEETQIDIAVGPYAKDLPLDSVKLDKSYHVCELDPISQTKIASKFRKWINPIHGRIFVVLTTSFALVGIFFQSLIYNRLNKWETAKCGGVYVEPFSLNSMLGPCSKTLSALGGLVVNELRQGEMIRMFWAMWMHTGFIHIGFNVISQAQLGYMIEPDWGMLRFFLLFFLSGVGGNLAVAVISPCSLTVGSSGGLFGITAASIPYTFENWNNLPAPMFMFIFSLVSLIIGMILSFTGVTNPWAHIGGFIVGLLYTFATMKACKGCSPEDRLDRYNRMAALPLFRLFMKQDKDWINRQLEEKKRRKIEKRNAKIAEQWRKNQRVKKNALIKQMKVEQVQGEVTDCLGLMVDEHGIKRRTDLTILIDRTPAEKIPIKTRMKAYFKNRIKSLREKKLLWTFRILSGILLLFYFIIGWLGTFYPPLYWPNPIGVISFSEGATVCGCCYVKDVYTCGSNPEFITWCEKQGVEAQPQRSVFGFNFT
ncbi:transmembrane domain-containing protein [Cryptosporidium canis]|uniref:Rhomboid-like protease n=1 Tax=Cryptosporidium canis TaxID=195482 RepID=A0A9D5HUX1_9CRYT|nr:transmembrane domain-containing protein [Cryptosporidium canis]